MRVMVVDDDQDICFTVETIGSYAGWSVHSCLDVGSALATLDAFNPDILLLDYHLPFMNGLAALPKFKKKRPAMTIIMLTVEEDAQLAEKCREAGANDYSLKPIKALDLIHRVNLNLEVAQLRKGSSSGQSEQPEKGMSQETVDLVLNFFDRNASEYFTINQVAAALQLGYSTTHRYLSYFEEKGYLTVTHGYGRQGRPRKKYRVRQMKPM